MRATTAFRWEFDQSSLTPAVADEHRRGGWDFSVLTSLARGSCRVVADYVDSGGVNLAQ